MSFGFSLSLSVSNTIGYVDVSFDYCISPSSPVGNCYIISYNYYYPYVNAFIFYYFFLALISFIFFTHYTINLATSTNILNTFAQFTFNGYNKFGIFVFY